MEVTGRLISWPLRLLLLLHLVVVGVHVDAATPRDDISQLLSDAKAELVRDLFEMEDRESGDSEVVNVTHTYVDGLTVFPSGQNVRMFRSADQNFLYAGTDLYQIQKKDSGQGRYSLNAVHDIRLDDGAVFFKNAEWKNKMFLVVCYQLGYCEIRVSAPSLASVLKVKINTGLLPLDVTFYGTDDDLYLITVLDPVTIYRWTGTYFNEDYRLDTAGAQSVAVIQDGDKHILVVAQNLGNNMVYSKVFIRKNDKIELYQLLPTHQALRVLPFTIAHNSETLHFVFVLNNVHASSIFLWTGKEFVLWKSLDKLYGQRIVYPGEIGSRTFFFVSDANKLFIYHPTVTRFDLIQIISFDRSIVGIDLIQESNQLPMLMALTGAPMDPYFKVNLILLRIAFNYIGKEERRPERLRECLENLRHDLGDRRRDLDVIFRSVIREDGDFEGIEGPVLAAANLVRDSALDEAVAQVTDRLDRARTRLRDLAEAGNGPDTGRRYGVHGDVTIHRLEADVIDADILNGRPVRFQDFLSMTRDQDLQGAIDSDSLVANALEAPSLNGISVNDILLRNQNFQKISGDFTLKSLTAGSIEFGPNGRLNGIPAADIVLDSAEEKVVRGGKTFSKLKADQVEAERINDVPADDWLAMIMPSLKDATEGEPLNFSSLSVEKLWISKLNGVPWEEFISSIYLPVNNAIIKGNVTVEGPAKIQYLIANKVNGAPLAPDDEMVGRPGAGDRVGCPRANGARLRSHSLPFDVRPNWDDSFFKDVLNSAESDLENDVTYFRDTQTILSDVLAAEIFVRNPIELSGQTVNLSDFTSQFWMRNENQTIEAAVSFPNGISVNNSLTLETVNGRSLQAFAWIDRPNDVASRLAFDNVRILGDVNLSDGARQNVNLRNLSETAVKRNDDDDAVVVISGTKRFTGSLTIGKLTANTVNGVDVTTGIGDLTGTDFKNSDVLFVSELVIGDQLTLEKGARGVKTVNGIDFNKSVSQMLTWNDPNALSKARYNLLKVRHLKAGTINGRKIEDKLPELSQEGDTSDVTVVIEGNLEVPSLNVKNVNGVNFNKFMKQVFMRNESQSIRGEKVFKETITVTGNLRGTLNGYNVTELERTALSKTKHQTITGQFTVEDFKGNDVEVEVLDGVPMDQVLFQDANEEQVINSDVVFHGNVLIAGDIKTLRFMEECDLTKVSQMDFENVDTFENLEVRGNVTWDEPITEPGRLSYFLDNVVSASDSQVVTGPVTFTKNVLVDRVQAQGHVNGVDLGFIANDAVFISQQDQEIRSTVTFKGRVRVDNIDIRDEVLVDTVNGVDITDIGQRLVKKNADAESVVTGRKIFKQGFIANGLKSETINGAKVDQILFYDDVSDTKELYLPPSAFANLIVFNDMTVSQINGQSLNKTIKDRLPKRGGDTNGLPNHVTGHVMIRGDVIIEGNVNIERLNDVLVADTILTEGEPSGRVISGNVEFLESVSIVDRVEVGSINGENITNLYGNAILIDEDAVIEGDIQFLDNVTVNGQMNVNDTLNECHLSHVKSLSDSDAVTDAESRTYRRSLAAEVDVLANLTDSMSKPVVFMYLEEAADVDLQLPSLHASTFNQYGDTSVEFNVYGMMLADCGLPSECYCPAQTNVYINSMTPPAVRVGANSTRFFKYFDRELKMEVTVTTNTVSYSTRCRKSEDDPGSEQTSVSWRNFQSDETFFEVDVETGFLSDVKFFRLGDSIYVVMAFYFHPYKNQTNNLHTVVYELRSNGQTLMKVDEIPSTGVQVLEVFWTMKGIILVVGNSFDSDRFTDSVNSGIYRFNEYRNKFELLRYVKTHGILAINSMRFKKTSFIFFVQKQTWPMLILKYNQEYDNYYFSQKLDATRNLVRSNFLSTSVISTGGADYYGDMLLGIVLSDDSFRLFKYKHIEGFVEETYQEQNNVRILHPFWLGSSQYLLAGSSMDTSKIYKFIEQGR